MNLSLPRSSGVQLHPTSLPGGRLGRDAYAFVDWLADDRQDRLMVGARIVEAVQDVNGSWTGCDDTHAKLARELRMSTGHEGSEFFHVSWSPLHLGRLFANHRIH